MNLNEIIKVNGQFVTLIDIEQKINNQFIPEWERKIWLFIFEWCSPEDFILQKTSGSTGEPKEMKLQKRAMIASAKTTIDFFQLNPDDTAWLCLPIDYIAGKMMVVRALVGQLNLIISEPLGIPRKPAGKIDFTAMVPMQVKKLINEKTDFSEINKLIIGGAEIDYSLRNSIQKLSTKTYVTYGMTETCSHVAVQQINGEKPDEHFRTLPGITVQTNNSNCLVIDAPMLANSPIQTTDLAEILSPTAFRWLGRADNVINSGGIKISPEEIEAIIRPFIHSEYIVSKKKDNNLGERAVLVIEGKDPVIDTKNILLEISEITGKYKAPKEIFFLEKLPLNASMKIDRKKVALIINQ